MRALAGLVMRGWIHAGIAVTVITILSWLVPPLTILAAAALALPTLRVGARHGAWILGLALTLVAMIRFGPEADMAIAVGSTALVYGPTWLAAVALRESGSLVGALVAIAALGVVMVVGTYLAIPDPSALWSKGLRMIAESAPAGTPPSDTLFAAIEPFSRYLTGAFATGIGLSVTLGLLLARSWQAMLFFPGGFKQEFQALRMPHAPAYFAALMVGLNGVLDSEWAEITANSCFPAIVPFVVCGFAVLHSLFNRGAQAQFWLIGLYVLVVVFPSTLLFILLIGWSDAWANWRVKQP